MATMFEPAILISIIVPVYRSEPILPELVRQVETAMRAAKMHDHFELVLVDDSSPDDSWRVIRELANLHPFVHGISLSRNFGQHNATMAGLHQARGEIVVIMDDDLQHPPQTIMSLVREIQAGFDACYTNYIGRKHALWKRIGSEINDRVATFLLKKPSGLYLSSYKALHRRIVDAIVQYDGPYAYIDGLILDATRRITSVPIQHQERLDGEGNYGLRRSISLWLRMATSFSVIPLRLASIGGFILAGLSAVLAIFVIADKLLHPAIPAGWASMATLVLFMGGVQLLCLGIIGEYIGRAYLNLNRKPQFVVRERTSTTSNPP
ncbi:MAG: glycosyltransferase family 2 protein [Proteobacteria bacterium]|nr:glycosyltransferase family 2 protein [Pseudomonadota bacterium]